MERHREYSFVRLNAGQNCFLKKFPKNELLNSFKLLKMKGIFLGCKALAIGLEGFGGFADQPDVLKA